MKMTFHNLKLIKGSTLNNRWTINKQIGQGGFGDIYEAYDRHLRRCVAIKVESNTLRKQVLRFEVPILKKMQFSNHACRLIYYGIDTKFNYLVMTLQGENLTQIIKLYKDNCLPMSTAMQFGAQIIQSIEDLHIAGYLHRDIKPSNFALGRSCDTRKTLFLLDFGLSTAICPSPTCPPASMSVASTTMTHPATQLVHFCGTMRYASINVLQGGKYNLIDDLWSAFYVIVELKLGKLPWTKVKNPKRVLHLKKLFNYDFNLRSFSQGFHEFYHYLIKLQAAVTNSSIKMPVIDGPGPNYMPYLAASGPWGASLDQPNYAYIRKLLQLASINSDLSSQCLTSRSTDCVSPNGDQVILTNDLPDSNACSATSLQFVQQPCLNSLSKPPLRNSLTSPSTTGISSATISTPVPITSDATQNNINPQAIPQQIKAPITGFTGHKSSTTVASKLNITKRMKPTLDKSEANHSSLSTNVIWLLSKCKQVQDQQMKRQSQVPCTSSNNSKHISHSLLSRLHSRLLESSTQSSNPPVIIPASTTLKNDSFLSDNKINAGYSTINRSSILDVNNTSIVSMTTAATPASPPHTKSKKITFVKTSVSSKRKSRHKQSSTVTTQSPCVSKSRSRTKTSVEHKGDIVRHKIKSKVPSATKSLQGDVCPSHCLSRPSDVVSKNTIKNRTKNTIKKRSKSEKKAKIVIYHAKQNSNTLDCTTMITAANCGIFTAMPTISTRSLDQHELAQTFYSNISSSVRRTRKSSHKTNLESQSKSASDKTITMPSTTKSQDSPTIINKLRTVTEAKELRPSPESIKKVDSAVPLAGHSSIVRHPFSENRQKITFANHNSTARSVSTGAKDKITELLEISPQLQLNDQSKIFVVKSRKSQLNHIRDIRSIIKEYSDASGKNFAILVHGKTNPLTRRNSLINSVISRDTSHPGSVPVVDSDPTRKDPIKSISPTNLIHTGDIQASKDLPPKAFVAEKSPKSCPASQLQQKSINPTNVVHTGDIQVSKVLPPKALTAGKSPKSSPLSQLQQKMISAHHQVLTDSNQSCNVECQPIETCLQHHTYMVTSPTCPVSECPGQNEDDEDNEDDQLEVNVSSTQLSNQSNIELVSKYPGVAIYIDSSRMVADRGTNNQENQSNVVSVTHQPKYQWPSVDIVPYPVCLRETKHYNARSLSKRIYSYLNKSGSSLSTALARTSSLLSAPSQPHIKTLRPSSNCQ